MPAGRGRAVAVAVRANPGGGEENVERQDMATLHPMRWLNDNIINFVGKS